MNRDLENYYKELGISDGRLQAYRLPFCKQANLSELEVADIDFVGRSFVIASVATGPWQAMCSAATSDNVLLKPASGFRSYLYQAKLIERQIAKGRSIDEILSGNAIPGFSEHHTGCAIDVIGDLSVPESEFHGTETYSWMLENASRFKFRLSYPRDNPYGIIFEPWHWFFEG